MDLSQNEFDVAKHVEAGATLHLLHPFTSRPIYDKKEDAKGEMVDDISKPATITLRGIESASVRKVGKVQQARAAKGAKIDNEKLGLDTLQAATIGWDNIGDASGQLEFTPENLRTVYLERDWIGQQVLGFISERNNFFTG